MDGWKPLEKCQILFSLIFSLKNFVGKGKPKKGQLIG